MYSNRHLAPRGSSRLLVILSYLSTHVPTIAQTWLGFFISFPTTYVRALHHQSRRCFYRSLLVVDLPNDAACSNNRSLPSTVNLSGIYRHMTYPPGISPLIVPAHMPPPCSLAKRLAGSGCSLHWLLVGNTRYPPARQRSQRGSGYLWRDCKGGGWWLLSTQHTVSSATGYVLVGSSCKLQIEGSLVVLRCSFDMSAYCSEVGGLYRISCLLEDVCTQYQIKVVHTRPFCHSWLPPIFPPLLPWSCSLYPVKRTISL